ncbi:MAG TPA: hypothetical protein DIT64_09685 [Verrucomicrobiales bacterium]|nr:hypothetical protein [Verrucomicrobiales bacterium]HCN78850.1 hypothetical protein [Verrucomicrobiales bacterium]HRJ10285.1 DUF971 domain-containing protein [Prosthecobacter sp.]HRK14601.1 DUF971 domain-containing protein [Prosthecobacter sp.]
MTAPEKIEVIGKEVAIRWRDGAEDYITCERLRVASPSAENTGERDLTGRVFGGTNQKSFSGVGVRSWRIVGGYAIQFEFTDGHNTGLYSFDYLRYICRHEV